VRNLDLFSSEACREGYPAAEAHDAFGERRQHASPKPGLLGGA
jgi:hypothetical protein